MTRAKPKRPQTEKRRAQVRAAYKRWYARKKAAREAKLLEDVDVELEAD
jgi:hypothetical protein